MVPLNCCGFRRSVSPDPQPVKLVDTSQPNKRFALSSHSVTPPRGERDEVLIPNRLLSTSEEHVQNDLSGASGANLLPLHDADAAGQVKKRRSRDSRMSKRSSKSALNSSMSFEDTGRRAELKRALHRRVKNSLLDDSTTDDEHYDEDAVLIETPQDSVGRHEGSVKISPRQLSNVLRRSESPSSSVRATKCQRETLQTCTTTSAATALSRMLTQRAEMLSEELERQDVKPAAQTPKRTKSEKYNFDDEETPKMAYKVHSQSLQARTEEKAAIESEQHKPSVPNFRSFKKTGGQPSPDLAPPSEMQRLSSVVERRVGVHTSGSESQYPFSVTASVYKPLNADPRLMGVYDSRIRSASEGWLHGASGVLSPTRHVKFTSNGLENSREAHDEHSYDLHGEEAEFGGIDGSDDSPPISVYHTARTRTHSEGNESTGNPHIYNIHVPKRLLSQALLPSDSLLPSERPRHQRSFVRGGSGDFSVKAHREPSSSDYSNYQNYSSSSESAKPGSPNAWDKGQRASSSIYSSRPESLIASQQSSLQRITSLQDRLRQIKAYTPNEDIISVPASRGQSIDLDKLEQQTSENIYHSSNESLVERELAAAETRIAPLPRANTLPKTSRFKEELDLIACEIARTNPIRRRVSNLDGSGEWNRASQALYDSNAASIWERALREHSEEDTALKHTRLGSDLVGPMDREFNRKPSLNRKTSNRQSMNDSQDNQPATIGRSRPRPTLQERLASYRLPAPIQPPPKNITKDIQRSPSARSTSSWARFPSHTRDERSLSPAGEQDQVYTRDFANMTPERMPEGSQTAWNAKQGKDKDSTSFSQHVLSSIKHTYRTHSQELQRRLTNEARGHRSSISQGGVLEYPELEMLGRVSPPLPSPDVDMKIEIENVIRKASYTEPKPVKQKESGHKTSPMKQKQHSSEDQPARRWSRMYEECVVDPAKNPSTSPEPTLRRSTSEIDPKVQRSRKGSKARARSRMGSGDLRASTLDFKRSLELDEEGARERLRQMMAGE
ncbi:hypothetical protein ACLMJK_007210 [Lecanora helva]